MRAILLWLLALALAVAGCTIPDESADGGGKPGGGGAGDVPADDDAATTNQTGDEAFPVPGDAPTYALETVELRPGEDYDEAFSFPNGTTLVTFVGSIDYPPENGTGGAGGSSDAAAQEATLQAAMVINGETSAQTEVDVAAGNHAFKLELQGEDLMQADEGIQVALHLQASAPMRVSGSFYVR